MTPSKRCWAAIPAAGIGSRMRADRPKQYLELQGRRVIDHTLQCFVDHPAIRGVVVALHPDDPYWPECELARHPRVCTVAGGAERADSVLAMLEHLRRQTDDEDWVLVHDAARPCLPRADLERLLEQAGAHPVGGLLATPVADTMKRSVDGEVLETVSREHLWHALTPQMFRIGALHEALVSACRRGALVTDDASAMELGGLRPLLVEGSRMNLKITRPDDLALAAFYLRGTP